MWLLVEWSRRHSSSNNSKTCYQVWFIGSYRVNSTRFVGSYFWGPVTYSNEKYCKRSLWKNKLRIVDREPNLPDKQRKKNESLKLKFTKHYWKRNNDWLETLKSYFLRTQMLLAWLPWSDRVIDSIFDWLISEVCLHLLQLQQLHLSQINYSYSITCFIPIKTVPTTK